MFLGSYFSPHLQLEKNNLGLTENAEEKFQQFSNFFKLYHECIQATTSTIVWFISCEYHDGLAKNRMTYKLKS
eukprot:m.151635 g.151635  ORF g.151635 m.151635 type:complete len:73 (-) comp30770_c2_seq4:184-402(-)